MTEPYEPIVTYMTVKEQDRTPKIDLKTNRPSHFKVSPTNGSMSGSRLIIFDNGSGSTAHKQAVQKKQIQTIHPDLRRTFLIKKAEQRYVDQNE